MRFEQPIDGVVARFPELGLAGRERTVPYVTHDQVEAAVALGRRLQARQVRAVAGTVIARPIAQAGRKVARALSALVREYRRDRARRATIRELSELQTHQLRDIGLERGDIVAVAEALADAKFGRAPAATPASEPVTDEPPFEPLRAA